MSTDLIEMQVLPTLRLFMQPTVVTMLETWPNGVPKSVSSVPMDRFVQEMCSVTSNAGGGNG